MQQTLAILGSVAILAAIVGGGLAAAGATVPVIPSIRRQILLGVAGAGFLVLAFTLADEGPDDNPIPEAIPATTTAPATTSVGNDEAASATTTQPSSTTTKSTTTTTALVVEEDPLTVFVEADPSIFLEADWQPVGYVFPMIIGQVGSPPSDDCRTWYRWARDLGGADSGGTTFFQISLSTSGDETIVVDGFTVEVIRRDPPIHGVETVCPAGGPSIHTSGLSIDLDSDPVRVDFIPDPFAEEPIVRDLLISIAPSEIVVLEVWTFADDCDCEWVATIHYQVGRERRSVEVTLPDGPFRTSGSRNAESWYWWDGDWSSSFGG